MTTELIRLEGINKSFGNVQALKDIDLKIDSGEIVALLGDNGAGKSTLIKALSGVYPIDKGAIFFKGKHASIRSARDAIDLGIETIHQDSSLAPDLSNANNLFLGREPMRYAGRGPFPRSIVPMWNHVPVSCCARPGFQKTWTRIPKSRDCPVVSASPSPLPVPCSFPLT